MTKAEELFHEIASNIPDAKEGKMFGALCFKAPNGKAAAMFWKEYMIFKLEGDTLTEALALDGAKVFEPAEGRPMGGWVQLSYDYKKLWPSLAEKAMEKVRLIKVAFVPIAIGTAKASKLDSPKKRTNKLLK